MPYCLCQVTGGTGPVKYDQLQENQDIAAPNEVKDGSLHLVDEMVCIRGVEDFRLRDGTFPEGFNVGNVMQCTHCGATIVEA